MHNIYVDSLVATVPPVQLLRLSDPIRKTNEVNFRRVNISWQETTTEQHQRYNVTVEPGVQGCNTTCMSDRSHMELNVAIDTPYNISIITVICNGSLESAASEPLLMFLKGKCLQCVAQCMYVTFSKSTACMPHYLTSSAWLNYYNTTAILWTS